MSTSNEDAASKAGSTPHPEDDRKPDSPAKIEKPARKYIVKKTIREFTADQCTDLAAALTYYAVLSIFPALLALVSLLGVTGQAQATTDAMLSLIEGVAPGSTDAVRPVITNLVSSPAAGLTLIIGLAAALWSASGYVGAFGRAMNKVYEVDEGRPFWKLKPMMLLITLVLLLLVVLIAILLVVSGPIAQMIGDVVGLGSVAVLIWSIAKWPVLIFFAVLMIAILYYATPNVKQPKFKWMSLGALFALLVLAVASLGFYFYVSNFGSYNATYGAIGGVIVALLWFWLANLSLLFGAELDAEMERGRQLQAGFEAEETIQLPPRDTRQSKKLRDKEREEVRQGRELREEPDRTHGSNQ
ncbi:YihY/virulence factor BrkB family protein [Arthrobacter sp. H14]|uniref:YihY/virulence factor BrkB family protein n=1 Tax=Arthrobacter sp. H14 TaxID=1312959 RepID=UPI0004B175EB|nr:YihY/virulence factor BrkB family protein [Arthrobacter sp. H14]